MDYLDNKIDPIVEYDDRYEYYEMNCKDDVKVLYAECFGKIMGFMIPINVSVDFNKNMIDIKDKSLNIPKALIRAISSEFFIMNGKTLNNHYKCINASEDGSRRYGEYEMFVIKKNKKSYLILQSIEEPSAFKEVF